MTKKAKIAYALMTLLVLGLLIKDLIISVTSTGRHGNGLLTPLFLFWGIVTLYVIVNKNDYYRVNIYTYGVISMSMFLMRGGSLTNSLTDMSAIMAVVMLVASINELIHFKLVDNGKNQKEAAHN